MIPLSSLSKSPLFPVCLQSPMSKAAVNGSPIQPPPRPPKGPPTFRSLILGPCRRCVSTFFFFSFDFWSPPHIVSSLFNLVVPALIFRPCSPVRLSPRPISCSSSFKEVLRFSSLLSPPFFTSNPVRAWVFSAATFVANRGGR